MLPYLKIKIKSLAAEAQIIRHEERKYWGGSSLRIGLHLHRVNEVRSESRSAGLAYGFLRGKYPYAALEASIHTKPNWKRVEILMLKYAELSPPSNAGKEVLKKHLKEWRTVKT